MFDGHAMKGAGLIDIVAAAFEIEPWNVIAPAWFYEVDYDVAVLGIKSLEGVHKALRQALIEKFSMLVHQEQRPADVWVMKTPGGPKPGLPEVSPDVRPSEQFTLDSVNQHASCTKCSITDVLKRLQVILKCTVLDETDLTGLYRFDVRWERDDPGSMVEAWREALGIELVKEMRMTDVLVVDAAERPPEAFVRQETKAYPCEAAAGIRRALEALPSMEDFSLSYEERMKPRRELARQYPLDVFVQMRVQDAFRGHFYLAGEWDRALAAYRTSNHPVLGPFLEARLLAGVQRKRAESLLRQVVQRAPDFPWAHLVLVALTSGEGAEEHMQRFRRLCPESLPAFAYYVHIDDPQMLREARDALGRLLSRRIDAEVIRAWPHYWDLQFRTTPPAEHEVLRRRMRVDLMKLRFLNRVRDPVWIRALQYGYKLARDEAGLASLKAMVLHELPESPFAYEIVRERWSKDHPAPGPKGSLEEKSAHQKGLFAALGEWQGQFPGVPQITVERWQVLCSLSDLPPKEVESLAHGYLRTVERYPDLSFFVPPAPIQIAGAYLKARLRLGEVADLVGQGFLLMEQQEKHRLEADDYVPEGAGSRQHNSDLTYFFGRKVMAGLFLVQGEREKAWNVLDQMKEQLGPLKPSPSASEEERSHYQMLRESYRELTAMAGRRP